MKKLFIILFCIPLLAFSSDEKRLALVIGNSNYDKAPLNNPVNDALLMAKTLEDLDFDVILDTNISNKRSFINTIREFGTQRTDYNVALVYYAGHGIQVGAENYLLPTKEVFETEDDVYYNGVNVQEIMRFLKGMTDNINILILDACRDNPFEKKWNQSRSIKGAGLAKIPAPTGSLIAFSTDAGNTAADGDGENSIYCKSLCKNMNLDEISIDQVFRNVRSEVLLASEGNQRPIEASQLTGETYYFNQNNLIKYIDKLSFYVQRFQIVEAENLLDKLELKYYKKSFYIFFKLKTLLLREDHAKGIELINKHIETVNNDNRLLKISARFLYENDNKNYAKTLLRQAIKSDNSDSEAYYLLSIIYKDEEKNDLVKSNLDSLLILNLSKNTVDLYNNIAMHYFLLNDTSQMNSFFRKSIFFDDKNISTYRLYLMCNSKIGVNEVSVNETNTNDIISFANSAIKKFPESNIFDAFLSEFYFYFSLEDDKNAKELLEKCIFHATRAIEINNNCREAYQMRSAAYTNLSYLINDDTLKEEIKIQAINDKQYEIDFSNDLIYYFWTGKRDGRIDIDYYFLGQIYYSHENYSLAAKQFKKSIEIAKENGYNGYRRCYNNLVLCYYYIAEYDKALKWTTDIITSSEDTSLILTAYEFQFYIYKAKSDNYNASISINKAISLDSDDENKYEWRAEFYNYKNDYENALLDYNKCIELNSKNIDYYYGRANLHSQMGNQDLALEDLNEAEKYMLETESSQHFAKLGIVYQSLSDFDKAFINFQKSIDLDNNNMSPLFYRAKLYSLIGEFENQRKDLLRTITFDPEDPEGYYFLALSYFKENNFFKAINYMSKSIEKFSEGGYIISGDKLGEEIGLSELYLKRADIYNKAGATDMACESYKLACDLGKCDMFNENCK